MYMEQKSVSILMLLAVEYGGVMLAVFADLAGGIMKSRREGRRVTSRGLRRTVGKLQSYYLSLFSVSVVDAMVCAALSVLGDGAPVPVFPYLTTLGSVLLCSIEVLSIIENMPERPRIGAGFKKLTVLAERFFMLRKRVRQM